GIFPPLPKRICYRTDESGRVIAEIDRTSHCISDACEARTRVGESGCIPIRIDYCGQLATGIKTFDTAIYIPVFESTVRQFPNGVPKLRNCAVGCENQDSACFSPDIIE